MNFRTNDWLKKLNTNPAIPSVATFPNPIAPTPGMAVFPNPIAPTQKKKAPPTPWMSQQVSGPMQQTTGRVGGIQTTAQQTQPLSAQLGGWFGQSPGQQNLQPLESLMGWLSPYLTQALSQGLSGVFGNQKQGTQSWTQVLPQNITKNLLKQKAKTPKGA